MKLSKLGLFAALMAAPLMAFQASAKAADMLEIPGEVLYRERIALPGDASLRVQLIEIAKSEGAGLVVGEKLIEPAGQVPIAFSIEVDRKVIAPEKTYGVVARISAGGSVWFSSKTPHIVDLAETVSPLTLMLVRGDHMAQSGTEQAKPAEAGLLGVTWRLSSLQGKELQGSVKSTLTLAEDGKVNGHGGCNNFGGSAKIDGASIKFGNLFSTMMACEENKMEQERAFHEVLGNAASYELSEGNLVLKDDAGKEIARLVHAE
ncbi:MAG: META domain-containing protein [Phyllobacterium sp.]